MEFPSKEFYNNSLRIASAEPYRSVQQNRSELSLWASRKYPIKLIDVVGVEQTRAVATEDNAQGSKYNVDEVQEAVCRSCLCIRH